MATEMIRIVGVCRVIVMGMSLPDGIVHHGVGMIRGRFETKVLLLMFMRAANQQ